MAEEAAKADLPPVEDAGLRDELTKLEDEINTLKQVLQSKEQQAAEMRRKLGIGPMQQIRSTFENIGKSETMQKLSAKMSDILNKENVVFEQNRQKSIWSDRMQKTTATLNEVGDATGKAFTAFGSTVSTKFSEMKSSPSFQSFEQKIGGVFSRNSGSGTPTATTPSEPPKE